MPKNRTTKRKTKEAMSINEDPMAKLLRRDVTPLSITLLRHFDQVKRGDLFSITNGHRSVFTKVSRVNKNKFTYCWHDGNKDRTGVIADLYDVILFRKHDTGVLQILAGTDVYPVIKFNDCYPNPTQQANFRA